MCYNKVFITICLLLLLLLTTLFSNAVLVQDLPESESFLRDARHHDDDDSALLPWETLEPDSSSPPERFYPASDYSSNEWFIVSGEHYTTSGVANYRDTWIYNFDSNIWQNETNNSDPPALDRRDGVLNQDGQFILWGGFAGNTGELDKIYMLDSEQSNWTSIDSEFLLTRLSAATTSFGSDSNGNYCLWVFGGTTNNHGTGSNRMFSYNFNENEWEELLTNDDDVKPSGRYSLAGVVRLGVEWWIYGGASGGNHRDTLDDMWRFSFVTKTWARVPLLGNGPGSRTLHSMTISPSQEYALLYGGLDRSFRSLGDLWVYNFATRQWHEIHTTGWSQNERDGHSAAIHASFLYIFGGDRTVGSSVSQFNDMHRLPISEIAEFLSTQGNNGQSGGGNGSNNDDDDDNGRGGLVVGLVVGWMAAFVMFVLLLAAVGYLIFLKRKSKTFQKLGN